MNTPTENLETFDENNDGQVDFDDRVIWVDSHKGTWMGDSNLDGEFSSGDLVQVFAGGLYEKDEMALWGQGDWNGDMRFGSGDLVAAFASAVRAELDHVIVGIAQEQLERAVGPQPRTLKVDAQRTEAVLERVYVVDAEGEVPFARRSVVLGRTADQVELLMGTDPKPGSREVEVRAA